MADQPFVIEPPGDATAVRVAAERAATQWRLSDLAVMRTGMNALFSTSDGVVLRVGRPTADPTAAIWLADHLRGLGIRVPRYARPAAVAVEGLAVYAIEHETAVGAIDWPEVGRMVARLHAVDPATVSGRYPTPRCSSFPWWQFERLLAEVDDLLDPAARRGIVDALARTAQWRDQVDRVALCHGDVHPGNVLATSDGPMLIDWDLLCLGPPAWDHAPLMTWTGRWGGEPRVYEDFADGYGQSKRDDAVAEAIAELRLVAATLMRLRAGRGDAAAADEAERRLRYWRGDADAPPWRAA